jgi:hypothetical protein
MAVAVYKRDLRMSIDAPFAAVGGSRNESRWPSGQRAAATRFVDVAAVHILWRALLNSQAERGSCLTTLRYDHQGLRYEH